MNFTIVVGVSFGMLNVDGCCVTIYVTCVFILRGMWSLGRNIYLMLCLTRRKQDTKSLEVRNLNVDGYNDSHDLPFKDRNRVVQP
jgi:hypothetical protein